MKFFMNQLINQLIQRLCNYWKLIYLIREIPNRVFMPFLHSNFIISPFCDCAKFGSTTVLYASRVLICKRVTGSSVFVAIKTSAKNDSEKHTHTQKNREHDKLKIQFVCELLSSSADTSFPFFPYRP